MKEHKERAFSELLDEKLPMLRRVVYRLGLNEHDADDVIQSALLKAWEKYDTFTRQAQLSSWVCRIACNQAYDLFIEEEPFEKRLMLEILLSNCTLAGGELTPQYRRPFDILIELASAQNEGSSPSGGQEGELPRWSGRLDSNQRPSAPKADALARLRYAPIYFDF